MQAETPTQVIFLSTYPPRECTVAAYTHELIQELKTRPEIEPKVIAVTHASQRYSGEVMAQFSQDHWFSHLAAADIINESPADFLMVEHGYDIYGGAHGIFLLDLLDRVALPYFVTCHHVPSRPLPAQREIMAELGHASQGVVVLSKHCRRVLAEVYGIPPQRVAVLPRGVAEPGTADREALKAASGLSGKPVVCSYGLFTPDKGFEYGIRAVAEVAKRHPDVQYLLLGNTHPDTLKTEGETYRNSLHQLARDLGIERNVHFIQRPLTLAEIQHFLLMCDIFVSPYPDWQPTVSNALAYAVSCGRIAVSTPYLYAQELLAEGRGLLAHFEDAHSLAACIDILIENPELRAEMEQNVLRYGHMMAWPQVAGQYVDYFQAMAQNLQAPPA
ncbi:MAG: glycosyltransferase [Oscillospiraceae bacterium]